MAESRICLTAIDQYARRVAQLPCFPAEPWFTHVQHQGDGHARRTPGAVMRLVATNSVPGQVLPHSDDVWLALLPCQDLYKPAPSTDTATLLSRRMGLIQLLVRIALSTRFRWRNASVTCGESIGMELSRTTDGSSSFWIDWLRLLSPDSAYDTTKELTRNLIALTQHGTSTVPRFLLCETNDINASAAHFPELLDQFVSDACATSWAALHVTEAERSAMEACGLSHEDLQSDCVVPTTVVELGLRFSKGKVSLATMTKLLDVIETTNSSTSAAPFRITTLLFGRQCSFQSTALELLGERRHGLTTIRLGSLDGVQPVSLRSCLTGLMQTHGSHRLRRLTSTTHESFAAVASAMRYGGNDGVEALDVLYEPTATNAAWLAFALFHVDSQSTVTSLRLRIPHLEGNSYASYLTDEWMDVFRRVLATVRPTRDLANGDETDEPTESSTIDSRIFVTLQCGTFIRKNPYAGARLLLKLDDEGNHHEFEQIAHRAATTASGKVALVVPGLGVGWVAAAAVVSQREIYSATATTTSSSMMINTKIKSFTWDDGSQRCDLTVVHRLRHTRLMLELLTIIGVPLEQLHLPRLELLDLRSLLDACPSLRLLNVSGSHTLTSIQPLVDAYEIGACQITSLSLMGRRPPPSSSMVTQQLTSLLEHQASPTYNGPSRLHQLAADMAQPPSSFVAHDAQPFWEALDHAKRLEFVQLSCPHRHEGRSEWTADANGQSAHSVRALPLRCRLALISVAYAAHQNDQDDHPASRLDASVLARILRFSHERIQRRAVTNTPLAIASPVCTCGVCRLVSQRSGNPRTSDQYPRISW